MGFTEADDGQQATISIYVELFCLVHCRIEGGGGGGRYQNFSLFYILWITMLINNFSTKTVIQGKV